MFHLLRALTPSQRSAVLASYLGWTFRRATGRRRPCGRGSSKGRDNAK